MERDLLSIRREAALLMTFPKYTPVTYTPKADPGPGSYRAPSEFGYYDVRK